MTEKVESGSRSRTRRAILAAAIQVFGSRPAASLGEVAAAAQVARSTLHRYFPDRADLLQALSVDVLESIERLIAAAAVTEGPPRAAFQRLVASYLELGPRLFFLFNEPTFNQPNPPDWVGAFFERLEVAGKPIEELIERGHAEGVFASQLPAAWITRLLWWFVYIGWEAVEAGELPRLAAPAIVLQTLESGVSARPGDA